MKQLLHLLVALRLRSLRFHSPRLCRVAVFLIQTNVSLFAHLSHRGIFSKPHLSLRRKIQSAATRMQIHEQDGV